MTHVRPLLVLVCLAAIEVWPFPGLSHVQDESAGAIPSPNEAPPGAQYVGEQTCAQCHSSEAATQPSTPMGHALESVTTCAILRAHPTLTFQQDRFYYEIRRQGEASIYSVTDGHETLSEPILYAFGLGEAGQTYIYEHKGSYYESRVSFFNDTQNLDLTLGHPRRLPTSLDGAAGRALAPADVRACFGCHSTGGASVARLQLDRMVPGVTCEACHGPGAEHVAAVQQGRGDNPRI